MMRIWGENMFGMKCSENCLCLEELYCTYWNALKDAMYSHSENTVDRVELRAVAWSYFIACCMPVDTIVSHVVIRS